MRSFLFLATNFLVVLTFGVFLNLLLPIFGIDLGNTSGLLIFCALFGVGGSFVSLLMSKKMALMSVRGQIITQPRNATEQWLLSTVERLAQQSGLKTPELAIYQSPDINAFATGANKDNALVAVSTGLLQQMDQDQAEAVLAHEVSHIANGDMVTMALIQGVLNTFVMFFARIVAGIVDSFVRGNDEEGQGLGFFAHFAVIMIAEIVFGLLASVVAMWFSRQREFRADAGAARLVGSSKMIAALERLKQSHPSQLEGQLTAFAINGKVKSLLSSHPGLDQRITALKQL